MLTISSKLVDINGLAFAVSEDTDPIDVGGFSSVISAVGAITAQFSDASTMTPNAGLRIGTLQTKIKTGAQSLRTTSIESSVVTSPENFIDGSIATVTGSIPGINAETDLLVVDFGVIATADLQIRWRGENTAGSQRNSNIQVFGGNTAGTTTTLVGSSSNILNGGQTEDTTFTIFGATAIFRFYRFVIGQATGTQVNISLVLLTESNITSGDVSINLRASNTINTANGTILESFVVNTQTVFTFDTDLLLVDSGQFYTLQIVSFSEGPFDVNLEQITSIKEAS